MTAPNTVTAARKEAEAARADFAATLHELQTRLSPREMARNAMDVARDRGEDLAERGVEFARERPGAAAGIAAGGLALLAHRPLLRGLKSLFRRKPRKSVPPPGTVTTALTAPAHPPLTVVVGGSNPA
ncbi:DUF3618 domain-containing protein [Sphingomonas jatrophae]|uniref:Uncharacterized protein n=1 Tax=Sphingomonas jatrophae TaxID=1166337 RepID=A0A1I6JMJ6_9SPHN|nr:DUF3618 domain-containing protein [Sphingomonas jatrophae]SFR80195.1 Protein of unknown function [Sphingomonas jatrophae]